MKKVKITLEQYIAELLLGRGKPIECNKSTAEIIQQYDNQTYISEDSTIGIISIKGFIFVKRKIKAIYLKN